MLLRQQLLPEPSYCLSPPTKLAQLLGRLGRVCKRFALSPMGLTRTVRLHWGLPLGAAPLPKAFAQ